MEASKLAKLISRVFLDISSNDGAAVCGSNSVIFRRVGS